MAQGQKAVEESLKAISIELASERASNEHLQAQTNRLDQTLAEQNSTVNTLRTTVEQLSQDLDLENNTSRQLQASQLKHQSDLIDLQTEKEVAISQNQQLRAQLTRTQSAYQDSVVQLHDTASRLAETRSANQELTLALASSEKTALELKDELAQVINEATLERQTMAQGQKAVEESLKAISIELASERASNEHLQAQTNRLDQTLAALQIDQQEKEMVHEETNARLADTQSALRSTDDKNEALQRELLHARKNAADLKGAA